MREIYLKEFKIKFDRNVKKYILSKDDKLKEELILSLSNVSDYILGDFLYRLYINDFKNFKVDISKYDFLQKSIADYTLILMGLKDMRYVRQEEILKSQEELITALKKIPRSIFEKICLSFLYELT